jgi:hypothetical protein
MAAVVTERWQGLNLQVGYQGTRVFDVSGVADAAEAKAATGVPVEGEAHPSDATLRAVEPTAQPIGPDMYQVSVQYQPPNGSWGYAEPSSSPGTEAGTRMFWSFDFTDEQIDTDANGKPIVNAAEQGYDPPLRLTWPVPRLVVIKRQASFDVNQARAYLNRGGAVNTDTLTVGGVTVAAAGLAKVHRIGPDTEAAPSQGDIRVRYEFVFRTGSNPWRRRLLQQGTMAMAVRDGTLVRVPIFTRDAPPAQVTSPVLLDQYGAVEQTGLYMMGQDDLAGATVTENAPPAHVAVETSLANAATVTWFVHTVHPELPFAALNL